MKIKLPIVIGGAVAVISLGVVLYLLASSGKAIQKQDLQNLSQTVSRAKAPDFSARDIFGKEEITIKKQAGKLVLLNFWATWCPPCKMEIPDLIVLQSRYKEQFVIIGVSVDQEPDTVRAFYKENKLNYPVIMATAEILESYGGITAIPTSFLINKNGDAVSKIVGYRSMDQYEDLIKQNL